MLAIIAAVATVVGVASTVIEITTPAGQAPFDVGVWRVNDFGTNNTIAALLAAGTMVLGALAWCFGYRWGAGLAGGAGAALAGWAALLIGLAELPISTAEAGAQLAPADITRDIGFWAVVGAGGVGVLVLLVSFARAGNDRRAGLDPWVAALAAVSALVAAVGPTIPEGSAAWSGNYSSSGFAVDLPTAFFAGRLVQLGLFAFCGVVGFLLVRRYGLGLAVGGAVSAGWMVATAATERTDSPIGLAFRNPPYDVSEAARRHDRRHGPARVLRPCRHRDGLARRQPLSAAADNGRDVVVVGTGGFAMACIDVLESSGHEVARAGRARRGARHRRRSVVDGADVFVAVMENRARQMLSHEVTALGGRLVTALSPHAVVSPSARIGAGAVLMPGAVVNAGASIGDGAIVNINAAVDSDVSVGAFAHVAVGASLAGGVTVGDGALIGVGASVTPGRTIGTWSTVGAGSAVVRDVAPGATVAGVPAKTTYGSALLR